MKPEIKKMQIDLPLETWKRLNLRKIDTWMSLKSLMIKAIEDYLKIPNWEQEIESKK